MDVRGVGRVALRTVVALASAATLIAVGLVWGLQQRLEIGRVTSTAAVPDAVPTPVGEEFTALLVGLDARTDAAGDPLPPELLDALHAGPDEGQLHTDTIMLLHVPAGTGDAVAISIPRDSFVPIAGDRGTHKINSAYRRGKADAEEQLTAQGVSGPELDRRGREAGRAALVATVQDLTGVTVDHFAEINLAGFVELTEALGGVPVCLNEPVRDSYSGLDLPAGPQTVSGAGALAFVRQRHGLDGGDLDRIARQQAFAAGLVARLTDAGTLSDPARLDRLVDVATRHVVLDRGWRLDQLPEQLRRLAGGSLVFRTIPTGRPDLRTPVDGVAVQVDPAAVRDFVAAEIDAVEPAGLGYVGEDVPPLRPTGSAAAPAPTRAPTGTPTTSAPPPISTTGPTCVD